MATIEEIIARWDSGEGKPYKGDLIDWRAYIDAGGDGAKPPADIGCMCAQGQVLHLLGGWEPEYLRDARQYDADRAVAKLLNISVTHAVLLRLVNDRVDGAPSIVLTHPERILGDQAKIVLAFWKHLDWMTREQWAVAQATAWDSTWYAAWNAAWNAAAAWAEPAGEAAGDAAGEVRAAAGATNEIQGARILRERGRPFYFLPMFGFATPEDIKMEGK